MTPSQPKPEPTYCSNGRKLCENPSHNPKPRPEPVKDERDPMGAHRFFPCMDGPGHGVHCGYMVGANGNYSQCALPFDNWRHAAHQQAQKDGEESE